ncbi:unnamed protein product [Rotaria magnacalcarata]|uniref:Endonuclease/exonuclease/phosphatase domain-containing protein n=1 Tax=Rotaria magnacalcarata TaxID=392030 RepID=A0A814X0D5_9BILA|nr:unnamed protein product [Rotaria magnacalcarata]CAF1211408.1 unnamed protein product [Rotaria magnacalcarata]CAF1914133.1 unnamed protein product [Rotaria magnacalcarata]CAF3746376.1 unnamed protein product [Rotaria magnacalcarata]CAF3780194.1 unnamed protein product [Rotaria magnacalcarata]
MVKSSLNVKRVECILPNVCAVDILTEETTRIIGVYASENRSWKWEQISPFITNNCALFGDFNVDLEMDASKAGTLLEWADIHSLAPFTPKVPTSRRSNRVIDFAFSNRTSIDIQTYSGNTTSDHLPVLAVLSTKIKDKCKGKSVHWKVFNLITEFTFPYWEARWLLNGVDDTYNDYVQFLGFLIARCSTLFPLSQYRVAIPADLRAFLSYIRALSFRRMRTKNIELKNHVNDLRKIAKLELQKFISSQLSLALGHRHTSSSISVNFWSETKRFIKPSSSSLNALLSQTGEVVYDSSKMSELAADYYEDFFVNPRI